MSVTLRELLDTCDEEAAYRAKYCHSVPSARSVIRAEYVRDRCRGQRVLSLGGSGPIDEAVAAVAAYHVSVDIVPADKRVVVDLDREPERVLQIACEPSLILCGEILEHLSNPGRLLDVLRQMNTLMIITVPNAFTDIGRQHMNRSVENVNPEHVAYYSYKTLKTLVERHSFVIREFLWYNGRPRFAEGLIFEVE